jgi:hypothetical protein
MNFTTETMYHVTPHIFDPSPSPMDSVCSNFSFRERHCSTLLPLDFTPTPYTVVCGRGNRCALNVGNRRLQVIASMFIGRYSLADRKEDKSIIVSDILEMVQEACPDKSMAFVRYSEGRWWEADNLHAREKIGAVLRDCLHSKYKSSTKSKLQKRKVRKATAKKAQMLKNLDKVRTQSAHLKVDPIPVQPEFASQTI